MFIFVLLGSPARYQMFRFREKFLWSGLSKRVIVASWSMTQCIWPHNWISYMKRRLTVLACVIITRWLSPSCRNSSPPSSNCRGWAHKLSKTTKTMSTTKPTISTTPTWLIMKSRLVAAPGTEHVAFVYILLCTPLCGTVYPECWCPALAPVSTSIFFLMLYLFKKKKESVCIWIKCSLLLSFTHIWLVVITFSFVLLVKTLQIVLLEKITCELLVVCSICYIFLITWYIF